MTRPSWGDFATHDESAYPELWDGVIGAWAPCLGPTGLRLHDHSRYNNWGTLTNMDAATDWAVSDGQYALDFDGVNDCVLMGSPPLISGAFPRLTKSLWVRIRDTSALKYLFADFNAAGNLSRLSISHDTVFRAFQNTATSLASTTTIVTGEWYMVTVARNDGTGASNTGSIGLYVNGRLEASATYSYSSPVLQASGEQLGRSNATFGDYPNAQIAEAQMWSRTLSANEIRHLYLLGRGGIYQRRRRTLRRVGVEQGAAFKPYWARRQNQIIGGGV